MTYNTSYSHHIYAIKSWLESLSTYISVSDYKLASVVDSHEFLLNRVLSINDPIMLGDDYCH